MAEQLDNPAFGLSNQNLGVAESIPNVDDSLSSMSSNMDNNSKVFWAVNCFILGMIVLSAIWCCFVQKHFLNGAERRAASDQYFQARLRRRQAREKAKNEEPLDKRQAKLHASFARNNAQMTVKESDLIGSTSSSEGVVEASTSIQDSGADEPDGGNDIEMGGNPSSALSVEEENGQLKLGNGKTVPNCCAICLDVYEEGDVVVWSSNPKCIHAFHRECVTDWLIKMQPETPCPCCRQEFTDLEEIRKVRRIQWLPNFAFDLNAIRFW